MFKTADGYITVGGAQENFWVSLCKVLGCEHFLDDAKYKSKEERVKNHVRLAGDLTTFFESYSTEEIWERLDEAGIPAGPVLNHVDVFNNPQTIERGMVEPVYHSKVGDMKTLGSPVKLSKTPAKISKSAPLLGEHNAEVLADWNISK
jgi:crotonobetainyl-CoA:carnitine CoA-transferase CaiB-like acyl-CoA transferase